MKDTETPLVHSEDTVRVAKLLQQYDTLQKVKVFLRDLARDGEAHMDPVRLYRGVCKALGEKPVKIVM